MYLVRGVSSIMKDDAQPIHPSSIRYAKLKDPRLTPPPTLNLYEASEKEAIREPEERLEVIAQHLAERRDLKQIPQRQNRPCELT